MSKKSNHVVPSRKKDGWAVKKSGSTRATKKFRTKDEAVKFGRELSKKEKTELYIHKKDGKIQDRRSFGNDPFPPRDKQMEGKFETNVFVNCPFDKDFVELLNPLLFTVVYLGYNPRISTEDSDAGKLRLAKITELVTESKYSIHDLSRLKSTTKKEYYRLNMPFEIGLDFGARLQRTKLKDKKCLIVSTKRYAYMKAISDLNGIDIKSHKDIPLEMINVVRKWFIETVGLRKVVAASKIYDEYIEFNKSLYIERVEKYLDGHTLKQAEKYSKEEINNMAVPEYIDEIKERY